MGWKRFRPDLPKTFCLSNICQPFLFQMDHSQDFNLRPVIVLDATLKGITRLSNFRGLVNQKNVENYRFLPVMILLPLFDY